MGLDFDGISVPEEGEIVEYDGEYVSPEHPIIPVVYTRDGGVIPSVQRILSTSAELLGRNISWLQVYLGDEALEKYGSPLPRDTVHALRELRIGILGPAFTGIETAIDAENRLRQELNLSAAANQFPGSQNRFVPEDVPMETDFTIFRDSSLAVVNALNDELGASETNHQNYTINLESIHCSTESLVGAAIEYALDHDQETLTIVRQERPDATEEGFVDQALGFLEDEYSEAVVDETAFRSRYGEEYPRDEVVVKVRGGSEVRRGLRQGTEDYDVIACVGMSGVRVTETTLDMAGGKNTVSELLIGDGRTIVSSPLPEIEGADKETGSEVVRLLLSSCHLFEYIGWIDVANLVRNVVSETFLDGFYPRSLPSPRQNLSGESFSAEGFADTVVERLEDLGKPGGSGGIPTTAEERMEIKHVISGVYNVVFEEYIQSSDIELNQILHEDEEAHIYFPEVGINLYYWRRWSAERRLEVILHELAHVDGEPGESDHGDEFYKRFVDLTMVAMDRHSEIEELFGGRVDFEEVRRHVVDSVDEETVETDQETVEERQRKLKNSFESVE